MKRSYLDRRRFLSLSGGALATGAMCGPMCSANEPTGATPSGPTQSNEGVVFHRDVHASDIMHGFPPPPERRVNLENWLDTSETLRWTHLNASYVFKSVAVDRGDGPVWVLPRRMIDPDTLDRALVLWGKTNEVAKRIPVAEWLRRSETDALVVVHDGHIVAEQYFGAMTPATPHLLWSASKSVLASIIAPLLSDGTIEVGAPATKYVPELSQCGLAGATVRQLLDMHTGIRAPCFPGPEEIGSTDEATLKEWTLGTPEFRCAENVFAGACRAAGILPPLPDERTPGYYEYVLKLDRDREHGAYFYYTDPNPATLQWVLERATQTSYQEHVERLFRALGAERNAVLGLDAIGTAVSSIGLSITARDFARWGLMLCNGGQTGNGQIIPGIRDLLDDVRGNPGVERWSERTNARLWALPGTGYRSQFWTSPTEPGREPIAYAGGAFFQSCYIDPTRKIVLVKFSSFSGSQPAHQVNDDRDQNDAVAVHSFLWDVLPGLIG